MKNLKVILFVLAFALCNYVSAQNNIPPEGIGTWKIVDVYAVDSTGNTDSEETVALMNGLVYNTVVEYKFTDTTFTLLFDGVAVGTSPCSMGEAGLIIFSNNGGVLSEYVNTLKVIGFTETTLNLQVGSPDQGSGVIWIESLIKQP